MVIIRAGGRRVVIDESAGALILSIEDHEGFELLAAGNPPDPALRSQRDLAATGYRGWIDCFPTIDAEPDTTNTRDALALAGHGELWFRSWAVDKSTDHSVELSTRLDELSVSYARRIALTKDSLLVSSIISNHSDVPMNYVWASHPLLAVDDATWIELDDTEVSGWPESNNPRSTLGQIWPATSRRRFWSDLPVGLATKIFMPWPSGDISFSSGGRVRQFSFTVDGEEQAPHLGLWLNRQGFPVESPLGHFAIEPTIGGTDSLRMSHARGTAGKLSAGSTASFEVELKF